MHPKAKKTAKRHTLSIAHILGQLQAYICSHNPANNNTPYAILSSIPFLWAKQSQPYPDTRRTKLAWINQKNGITSWSLTKRHVFNESQLRFTESSEKTDSTERGTNVSNERTKNGIRSRFIFEYANFPKFRGVPERKHVYTIRNPDTNTKTGILKLDSNRDNNRE